MATKSPIYSVEGWSNQGPVRFTDPMSLQRALSVESKLNDEGHVHISLTDLNSGAQAPWHTFDFWQSETK